MTLGNTDGGLLRSMIDLLNELGPNRVYDSNEVTGALEQQDYWQHAQAMTPERTVNSYFSQNPHVFERIRPNQYRLKAEYIEITDSPIASDIGEMGEDSPLRAEYKAYRILRDTNLARHIKSLHEDHCQLCGTTLQLKGGSYSEAHHVKPLGCPHNGPDIAANILVLCPNCHVLCDYGGVLLSRESIRSHPQHTLSNEYINYHNTEIARPE